MVHATQYFNFQKIADPLWMSICSIVYCKSKEKTHETIRARDEHSSPSHDLIIPGSDLRLPPSRYFGNGRLHKYLAGPRPARRHRAAASHYNSTSRSARHRPDPNCPKKNAAPAGRKKERLGAMSSRPNRSDVHLSPEDEAAREAEVRGYFDDAAPKRHTKPSRSEHSAVYADAIVPDSTHPELDKFQDLEAHTEVSPLDPRPPQLPLSLEPELLQAAYTYESSPCCVQRLVYEGGKVGEEFVETEYYKDLGGVGKQHHTVTTAGSLRFLPFFRDLGARELQNLLTPLSFLCQYAERADRNRLHQDGQRQGRLVQTVRKPRRSGAPRFLQGEPCHQRVDPIG